MFLAASSYFQYRFATSLFLLTNFLSFILFISICTNLIIMITFSFRQQYAFYSQRIVISLFMSIACFALFAVSIISFLFVFFEVYFAFLMIFVFAISLAMGICQNNVFLYVFGFEEGKYIQNIMMGHAIVGVLFCLARIFSVLSEPKPEQGVKQENPKSTFVCFMTSIEVSVMTLNAFMIILGRHDERKIIKEINDAEADERLERKIIEL